MISNPDLIHYVCIANSTAVLAEFSRTSDLQTLARRCIDRSPPPHHAVYTHTVRNRTYTFLIPAAAAAADPPPLFLFAITDELLPHAECLRFLRRLDSALGASPTKTEFDSAVASELAAAEARKSVSSTPSLSSASFDGLGFTPLLGGMNLNLKKKRRQSGEVNGDSAAVEVVDDGAVVMAQKAVSGGGGGGGGDRMKARQVWKKHVWVVLLLDLFVCVVLFGIWLWICRGFKCIEN